MSTETPSPGQPAAPQYAAPQYAVPPQGFVPPIQAPAAPSRNIVGIIALVAAGLGFIFACVPGAMLLGWLLLPVGLVMGIIAVCLKGKVKWQGLTAIIVAVVGTIVGFIVFFAVVATAVGDAFGDSGVAVGESTPVVEQAAEEEPAEAPVAEQGTRENPLPFGTPISTDEWDVTLTGFTADGNAAVAAGNMFNDEPGAGQVYVIVDLTAAYKGADEGSSMMVEVDYITAEGNVISSWDSLVAGVDPQFGTASLYAGAADTGKLVFLVPASVDGLIRVAPGMFADDVFFTLAP